MSTKPALAKAPIPKVLDNAALEAMQEPLMAQVSRIKGGAHTPIALPPGENGEPPGTGWNKGMVREMNSGWLAREWCGSGNYQFTITDASIPPQTLTWQSWFPPSEYGPERPSGTPPVIAEQPAAPATNVVPFQPQVTMPPFANGLPTLPPQTFGAPAPTPYQAPYAQPYAMPYQPPQPPMGYVPPGYRYDPNAEARDERRRLEERVAQAEAAARQAALDAKQREYDAQLERERAANAAAMQRLEQRIAELTAARQQPAVSPEVEALKQQNMLLQQRLEAEAREREMDRRERETREQMQSMKSSIDAQIAAQQANMQQLIASMNASKNDSMHPMMQFVLEQNRNSIAAMERISMQSTAAIEKLQSNMLSPKDIMTISREASQAGDQVINKMQQAYGSAIEMHQKVLENAMSLNQGGSPVVDMVREGITSVKEMAEKYVVTKGSAQRAEAQSKADIEKAKAQQAMAQAQAQAAMVRPQQHALPQPPRQVQPGLAGQNGAQRNGGMSFEEWQKQRNAHDVAAQPPRDTANVAPQPVPTTQPTNHGRTDLAWFGPALGEVIQTRQAFKEFVAELRKPQPNITGESATPDAVARGIATAAAIVQANGMPIPAMTELLYQGKYEEFCRVLLPEANDVYIKDLVKETRKLLDPDYQVEEMEAEAGGDDDGGGDDGDGDDEPNETEDGSPADDIQDGAVTKAPASKAPAIRVINPVRA